ncbi:MAG: DUF5591 domain-containing protein [Candidatus Heimdallarchaeota archaeon]|nr:DUF5591 domain-containing protein [Candidatus Heimdallarchaeota archaeon]MBY8993793.1 DUF5591 domain-containing protein [Candidatus Heimdallarchaeota archaeon]
MDSSEDFLIGGDELFQEPRFVKHYNFMIEDYIPNIEKPIAFFLSCSKHKPYNKSPYRRVFHAMLAKKLSLRDLSQIYTVSEPAIIVPEELDDTNITKYDFPPDKMKEEGRSIFIERLAFLLPKLIHAHKYSFYILPKHHRGIFEQALKIISLNKKQSKLSEKMLSSKVKYAPPLTYNLPKVREIVKTTLNKNNLL